MPAPQAPTGAAPATARSAAGRAGRARGEGGFGLVEQLVAISLMVGVLLTLLGALGSGAAGVVGGRQRSVATALAKQAVERLQGAGYAAVVMKLSSTGLASDSRVSGIAPALTFEGESLVGGGSEEYRTQQTVSGTTYTLYTYVTSVTPPNTMAHRRITVIVEWTPSATGQLRSQRFSSLVYPLDYASYPAASASAEAAGAVASVSGTLAGDTFQNVQLSLPSARSSTNSSTLRTARGSASANAGTVDVETGPLSTTQCTLFTPDEARCPLHLVDHFGDNDSSTTSPTWSKGTSLYSSASVTTPGGAVFTTPPGSAVGRASVEDCGGCGFGDGDGLPWADAGSTTSGSATATFAAGGSGGLLGSLWQVASGWAVNSEVDHDPAGGGTVVATATLTAPAVKVLTIDGASGFTEGAVSVPGFTATATAPAGYTTAATAATSGALTVKMWDGSSYRSVAITPGTLVDVTTTGTVVVGGDTVTLTSRLQSQPQTANTAGSGPRTSAVAQLPSLLIVTVDANVEGAHPATFTTTFNYGLVTARGTWQVSA